MRRGTRTLTAVLLCSLTCGARADLFEYLAKDEPKFEWRQAGTEQRGGVTITDLRFTSQEWQGTTWTHLLRLFEPAEPEINDHLLLYLTGGGGNEEEKQMGVMACNGIRAPFAILYHLPNQPLFDGKREDALIAFTFAKCLETGDENWPLLFPMTKAAVKAMDVLQAFSEETKRPALRGFVTTGASKRGWTTWFTGVADERVKGIAPIVYDNLNLASQMKHQLECWGEYSPMIHDYTERGLQALLQTETGAKLSKLVDPYAYRDRVPEPKLLINGTNDPYWTQDALNLYWDALPGAKHVLYVPNRGHDVRDMVRLMAGLRSHFRAVALNQPLPELDWSHQTVAGKLRLQVKADPQATGAVLWVAQSATRDFRKSEWHSTPMQLVEGAWVGATNAPQTGATALFGELTFAQDGLCMLSTQIRVSVAGEAVTAGGK